MEVHLNPMFTILFMVVVSLHLLHIEAFAVRGDELGPPISPEEFAKALVDATLRAPPPENENAIENSGEFQGDIILTPNQKALLEKVQGDDELGPPISPEVFAKAQVDPTLTARFPENDNAIENLEEFQGDIILTPDQKALLEKFQGDDKLYPPISPGEFAKAQVDPTLTATLPENDNAIENSEEFQGDIILTPDQKALLEKVQGDDELGPPISPEEFAKALVDPTLTAPPPENENAIENSGEFQGDIILTPNQKALYEKDRTGAATIKFDLWENGVIPYTIHSVFDTNQRQLIFTAMAEFVAKTCLKFIPRTTQKDYIEIANGSGCKSNIGRIGDNQTVILKIPDCVHFGTIIHEFMHAAGFFHEHSRYDRDDYITINWQNIKPDKMDNFDAQTRTASTNLGLPYDYMSIMHYGTHAFTKNRKPTITPKKEGATIGQRNNWSELDVMGLNLLYKCGDTDCQNHWSDNFCQSWADFCQQHTYASLMETNCKKTCNLCGI